MCIIIYWGGRGLWFKPSHSDQKDLENVKFSGSFFYSVTQNFDGCYAICYAKLMRRLCMTLFCDLYAFLIVY